ncbi:MAG: hypothetical protein V4516_03700 [Pseudomonadota bacterium]
MALAQAGTIKSRALRLLSTTMASCALTLRSTLQMLIETQNTKGERRDNDDGDPGTVTISRRPG